MHASTPRIPRLDFTNWEMSMAAAMSLQPICRGLLGGAVSAAATKERFGSVRFYCCRRDGADDRSRQSPDGTSAPSRPPRRLTRPCHYSTCGSCCVAVFPTRIGVSGGLRAPIRPLMETIAVLRQARFQPISSVAKLHAFGDDFPPDSLTRSTVACAVHVRTRRARKKNKSLFNRSFWHSAPYCL